MESESVWSVPTPKTVDEALTAVEASLGRHQFQVLWHLDINEKLAARGLVPEPPFHILEVCSAPRAKAALATNQRVGYFLPCKIVVYEDQGSHGTEIGLERPSLMMRLLGDEALRPLADEVEGLLKAAISEAARP
jgi:uncharacterized protein (DUF302 family)